MERQWTSQAPGWVMRRWDERIMNVRMRSKTSQTRRNHQSMSNMNTLYPNIQQIAAHVRSTARNSPCENCGSDNTKPYVFAYGKKLKEEKSSATQGNTTTTTTTTYYGSLNARAVHLCAKCVDSHRRAIATRLWVTIILLALLSITLIIAVIAIPGDQAALTIFATLTSFSILVFGVLLHNILSKPDLAGLDKALKMSRKELEQEGYDSFWRDPEDPGSI